MNAVDWAQSRSAYSRSMFELLGRVEYRRVTTSEDWEAVGRLRARSYKNQGILNGDIGGSLIDALDFDANATVIGMYLDTELAATLRIHHITREQRAGITMHYFGDVLDPMIDSGLTFVDPARFASDPQLMWSYPALPFLALRIAAMASEYFAVNYCLSCVNAAISPFYVRSFGSSLLAGERHLAGVSHTCALYAARIEDVRARLSSRYPFFKSQRWEQKMMFAPESELSYPPVNILPSARYVNPHLFS